MENLLIISLYLKYWNYQLHRDSRYNALLLFTLMRKVVPRFILPLLQLIDFGIRWYFSNVQNKSMQTGLTNCFSDI